MSGDEQSVKSDVRLDRIGQIALTVSDIAHAKNFYQNTLGMRHLFDAGTM